MSCTSKRPIIPQAIYCQKNGVYNSFKHKKSLSAMIFFKINLSSSLPMLGLWPGFLWNCMEPLASYLASKIPCPKWQIPKKVQLRAPSIDYQFFSHSRLKKDSHRCLLLIFQLSGPILSLPHGSIQHKSIFSIRGMVSILSGPHLSIITQSAHRDVRRSFVQKVSEGIRYHSEMVLERACGLLSHCKTKDNDKQQRLQW